jgi:hypothetical protein
MDNRMSKRITARRRPNPLLARRSAGWPLAAWVAGALLLAAVVWLSWPRSATAPKVQGAPRLMVDRHRVDLGPVKLGSWVEVKYRLTNSGDQPLRLTQAPYVEVMEGC